MSKVYKVIVFVIFIGSFLHPLCAQTILINEFCASNINYLDEDKDTPDWIELYNSSNQSVNLLNYSITDDITNPEKWKFPALTLAPKQLLLVFASDKNKTEVSYPQNIIKQGDTFNFIKGSNLIPADWNTLGFDDENWNTGPSGFGYGDNDDGTHFNKGTLSVFVRKNFTITGLNDISELILHIDYDDGFVAYINGIEVARANLGIKGTPVSYNQTADTYTEPLIVYGVAPTRFDVANFQSILKEGNNVLAIQVHNNSVESSDLSLIPFLTIVKNMGGSENVIPEILNLPKQNLHTNFKISADGEALFLYNSNGELIDATDSVALAAGVSYGLQNEQANNWVYFAKPTPNALNNTTGNDSLSSTKISVSPKGGFFGSAVQVTLTAELGDEIHYTTDGSVPTQNSPKYTNPITINKTTALRATVTNSNALLPSTFVESYIIENRNFNLPVMSLTTDPYNLWDWNYGIYVMGPNAETKDPYFNANFWMDWERPVHIEYFDKQGELLLSTPAGTKIFGSWSRAANQKSMSFFARSEYGNKSFDFPFFSSVDNNKYSSFILRNSGNDRDATRIRDAVMTGLLRNVDIDVQAYQPTAVYLNGEYWGILNLREKINEDYLAIHHPEVDPDEVDILENEGLVIEGSADHYVEMIRYIQAHNLSDNAAYDSVCTMMDVVNFMEYELAQIYYNNVDWPGNNIKYWRPQTPDGKWRWLLFGTDFGFGLYNEYDYNNNTLDFALATNGPDWPNPPWSTFLLRSLLQNNGFKQQFINRFADRINYEFLPQTVHQFIDSLSANIANEVPYHLKKWNDLWNFDTEIIKMKNYATNRPNNMRNFINNKFNLGGKVSLTANVSDLDAGRIQVNSLQLKTFPWTGIYFKNVPVPLKAIPNPGYEFSHWEGISTTEANAKVSIPSTGLSVKAVFKTSGNDYNSIAINEINYSSDPNNDCGDWVELYNTSNTPIDLSGWILKDDDDANGYIFANGTLIPNGGYLVVCRDQKLFTNVFPQVHNLVGNLNFGLSSVSDVVRLYNKDHYLVDSVAYTADIPWPYLSAQQTLSLTNALVNNALPNFWEPSAGSGTPGRANNDFTNIAKVDAHINILSASAFPNPTKNRTLIKWSCTGLQWVSIKIYDTKGLLISDIFNGSCSTGSFEEIWESDENVSNGIYLIHFQSSSGTSKTIKLIKQ